jgi:hypothetical protein
MKAPGVRSASTVGRRRSLGMRPLVQTVAEGSRRWGGARGGGRNLVRHSEEGLWLDTARSGSEGVRCLDMARRHLAEEQCQAARHRE